MALPILEQIVRNRLDVLRGITLAGAAQQTITAERFDPTGENNIRDGLAVLHLGKSQLREDLVGHDRYFQELFVVLYAQDSEGLSKDELAKELNGRLATMAGAIKKAWFEDYHCSNLAATNKLLRTEPLAIEGFAGLTTVLSFEVQYRTLLDDPFTQ